jgi:hypothetical protein
VIAVKRITEPVVNRKIEVVVREHNLPKKFRSEVHCDIAAVCMEAEYVDVCPPGVFTRNAYWSINGHFPCGWRGTCFQGKPVIY